MLLLEPMPPPGGTRSQLDGAVVQMEVTCQAHVLLQHILSAFLIMECLQTPNIQTLVNRLGLKAIMLQLPFAEHVPGHSHPSPGKWTASGIKYHILADPPHVSCLQVCQARTYGYRTIPVEILAK